MNIDCIVVVKFMLIVYHSNQPEIFKKILIDIMSNEVLFDPMQSEIILIENKIMIEWIQIELAKHFGIAANITFMDVSSFIRVISNKISPKDFTINDFNCAILYWKFMEILPKACLMQNFSIIERYLHDDFDKRKCGQLSEKLVELFTKYLIYRTDWLDNWKVNNMVDEITHSHQLWQSELWRMLLKSLQYNNAMLYENINYLSHCVSVLKNLKKIDNNFFPKRIFIFGITLMPTIYWEILNLLSNYIDIHVWFVSPYYQFSYNCIVKKNLLNITSVNKLYIQDRKVSTSFFSTVINNNIINNIVNVNIDAKINHILINFCGLVGKNTLWLLTKLENLIEKKFFIVPKEDSLLHILQKSILEWQEYIIIDQEKYDIKILKNHPRYLLESQDQSITVHICYSIQREIEVLHDNLLSMIQEDPFLLQKGIIVMAPDICDYAMAINTIFDNMYGRSLPFNISSNYTKCVHPIISTILNILNISYNRCTSEEILSFLKISLIAKKFNIKEEELKLLNQWVIESGIKWGLDDITMCNFNLPTTHQNTWCFGLTRMLLGHAIHNPLSIWEDVSPYNDFNTENINVVGYLGEFLKVLRKWRNKFNHSHTIIEWMPYMQEILDDFFSYSDANVEENKIFSLLKNCWRNILEPGMQSGYSDLINIIVLRDKLSYKLNQNTVNFKFLPNVINFCNISPICCISCQIICFLGMNKDAFPRRKIPIDFDLMVKNPRSDDHHIYNGDCYVFLLGLLLAQECIYISFIEDSVDDSTIDNASVLIHVLFEYISQNFYLSQDKYVDSKINEKHIRHHLQRRYNRVPFAYEHFILGSKIQSFANEWISSINVHTNDTFCCDFLTPLPQIIVNIISFYDLYHFYCHPIKVWFQKRLGVYFREYTSTVFNIHHYYFDDYCALNALHRFNLNVKLLNSLIHNDDVNAFYNSVRAAGILPYGVFGELYWAREYSKMDMLAKKIKVFYSFKKFDLNIFLKFDNVTLTGQLTMIQNNGLVRWKPAYLSIKDGLLLWLEHVVYCALGGTGDSRLFGINDTWHFPHLSQFQAKEFLFLLISGYLIGINTPLYLLYKSGGAWINQIFDWNTKSISTTLSLQKKACCKLQRAWQGVKYSYIHGEYHDPYLHVLMPYNLHEKDIERIIKAAKDYFLLPMKYKIIQ